MTGKDKCKILKELRQHIADENGIEIATSECKHKGDCKGTCPKCEQELHELEKKLRNKKLAIGSGIALGALTLSAVLISSSMLNNNNSANGNGLPTTTEEIPLDGDVEQIDGDMMIVGETTEWITTEPEDIQGDLIEGYDYNKLQKRTE